MTAALIVSGVANLAFVVAWIARERQVRRHRAEVEQSGGEAS